MMMRYGWFLLVFFYAVVFTASATYAQLGFGETLTLSLAPRHPAPGETVSITAESVLLDLEAGTLTWYVNGVQSPSAQSSLTMQVPAGSFGSETRIRAVFSQEGFEAASAEVFIRPTEIDLLWEADSYTPHFFLGRALPSAGTNLRMEALPRFKRTSGSFVPVSDITFTWRRNGYVIASASGRGKYRAVIASPPLFGTDTISVEAQSLDGLLSGETSVRIPSVEPILVLYENHPIFGILYHQALGAQNVFPEVEKSFAAVPYYADARTPADSNLIYTWRVDGNTIENDAVRPNEITLNAEGSTGTALIDLVLSHATNFFLSASGLWRVTLSAGTSGAFGDPFGGMR